MYAPIREEELSLNPRLVFLHQVLTDGEIEVIKSLARPKVCLLSPVLLNHSLSFFPRCISRFFAQPRIPSLGRFEKKVYVLIMKKVYLT